MITQQSKLPDLVPIHIQEKIATLPNIQYRAIGLLMLDAGLRPCEATQLQMKDFNFELMEIKVLCAKKRKGKEVYRTIKMTKRLLRAIGEQWKSIKKPHPHAYLFPARNLKSSVQGHLQAKQLSRWFRKNLGCMPKSCRHTFATRIVNSTKDIRKAKELLGHESQLTTEIYLQIPQQELHQAIESIEVQSWKDKWMNKLFPKKQTIFWQAFENGTTKFHVGRATEIAKMTELMNKKVNILLVGEHGVGKTHILENIPDLENRILRIDDLKSTARQMKSLVMELFIRLPDMANMMFQEKFRKAGIDLEGDPKEMAEAVLLQKEELIGKILSRDSIANLINLAIRITDKFQYTIIFDDLTSLSKNSVIALEKLKNHFHIIAAARQVKIGHQSAISNFQKIEINPLTRPEAMDLVHKMSAKFYERIEDYELYKNHIWEQTAGNPLYIYELVDRYRKETYVAVETVRDIEHTSGLKEVNMFPLVIGLIGCFSALRYIGKASGSDPGPFYMLAGIGMIFLFFGREMMRYGKRKWV